MEIRDYIDLIDRQYWQAKKAHVSRFSLEWGKWSREMNLELRKRIESKNDPDEPRLKYIFIYWINRSQLLEAYFKGRLLALGLKKRLKKQGGIIRKNILSGALEDLKGTDLKKVLLESGGVK